METIIGWYPSLGASRVMDALAFAYDNIELMEAETAGERMPNPGLPVSVYSRQLALPFGRPRNGSKRCV